MLTLALYYINTFFPGNRYIINLTADSDYALHDRMTDWVDINESDMKIFFEHLILMGNVKSQIAKYWSKGGMTETPYFGQTMKRNQFLLIMKNLHIVNNLFKDKTDELFKICPFVTMHQDNFKYTCTCDSPVSIDEACCGFRGKVKF